MCRLLPSVLSTGYVRVEGDNREYNECVGTAGRRLARDSCRLNNNDNE